MFSMQRTRTFLAIFIAISLLLYYPVGAESHAATKEEILEVLELLEANHISGVNESQLSNAAIEGMIDALNDPYTEYFSVEDWFEFQNSVNQNYVGIGVRVGEDENGFYAVEVFPDSPAQKGGVIRGDYIIAVEGKAVHGLTIDQLVERIKGPTGTKVKITIERWNEIKEVELVRSAIQIPVVTSSWFAEGIGYIDLSSFSEDAGTLFQSAMKSFPKDELKGLIVDLRGNPGGYLHIAMEIAEQFIEKGTLINTKDRNNVNNPIEITNGTSVSYPVVILVDQNSASASEVVAGAFQDYQLATIIGTKTYGKGTVQSLLSLKTGGVLKVTFEEYLTPKFRSVDGVGLTPDIEVQGSAAQMVTALHTLGLHHLRITATHHTMTINEVEVMDSFPFLRELDKVYVHSRFLAALIDGDIVWNDQEKVVEITKGDQKGTFHVSSNHVKWISGLTFIDLDHFETFFEGLDWSVQGEEIHVTFDQENDW